jgi:glycine cleavage system protein P-like pyridoxal-binding family
MKNINTIALRSLAKAIAEEIKERAEIQPGTYKVSEELNISLDAVVTQNGEEEYTPTISIPTKVTLALFVRYSGITGQAALDALQRAMTEAVKLGEKAEESVSEMANIKEAEAKVKKMLGKLPKDKRKGKCLIEVVAHGETVCERAAE